MRSLVFVMVILASVNVVNARESNIYVTGNPHMPKQEATTFSFFEPPPTIANDTTSDLYTKEQCASVGMQCPAQNILPHLIITSPKVTQPDTFKALVRKEWMGIDVPLYLFQQPARMSTLELPFKLLLVRDVAQEGLVELQVDMNKAIDSWFVGYYWSVILCEKCDGVTHLGWKFTSTADAESFYALIVDYHDSNEVKVRTYSGMLEAVTEKLHIGMKSPAWMISMMMVAQGRKL